MLTIVQDYWVKIAIESNPTEEPWVGKLLLPEDLQEQWKFELIRKSDSDNNPFSCEPPFRGKATVCGLLNFQTPCTLVYPLVTTTDPGSFGVYHSHQRQRIEGISQALVRQAAIEDIEEPMFSGLRFSSDSFLAWYGHRGFDTTLAAGSEMRQTTALPQRLEAFRIAGFGHVTCRAGSAGHMSTWEDNFTSVASISIVFDEIQSLKDTMQWCWRFETLFQFLTGINTKWPEFTLVRSEQYSSGEQERNFECELIFGRAPYAQGGKAHPFECCHYTGLGGANLEHILANFCTSDSIYERIQVINYTRFAKRPMTEDFTAIMPILEKYLRGNLVNSAEESFIQHQKTFFDYIDCSDNPDIVEFAKKHVVVKDKKAPSLKTLLWRAAGSVNASGFSISKNLITRVAARRGSLFHQGMGDGSDEDSRRLWAEAEGAAALLSLCTYKDLGVDIAALERGRRGNCEIANFFSRDAERDEISLGHE